MKAVLIFLGIAAISGAFFVDPNQRSSCGNNPADIVLILDQSSSIYPGDFGKLREFVQNYVQQFDLNVVRFGIIKFSTRVTTVYELGFGEGVVDAVKNLNQEGGDTYTYDAIDTMRQMPFRNNVPKMCIVITDGESVKSELTAAAAKKAREDGIMMIAIGIMDPTSNRYTSAQKNQLNAELRSIANSPNEVFKLNKYDELMGIGARVIEKICPTTTTMPTTTLPQMLEGCPSSGMLDLVFGIPSPGQGNERLTIDFVNDLVGEMKNLGPDAVQVGVTEGVCYGTDPAIALSKHDTADKFSLDLEKRLRISGTNAGVQLENAISLAGRNEANRIAVLIVDRKISDVEYFRAQLEINEHVTSFDRVLVLGVGADITDLQQATSGFDRVDVEAVANYNALSETIGTVKLWLCHTLKTLINQIN